jgi:hypothetical protein
MKIRRDSKLITEKRGSNSMKRRNINLSQKSGVRSKSDFQ